MPKKILVVDNEENIVNLLKYILESEGFNVITASNGEEALNKVHSQSPNLMILDLVMPKIDGWQVCKEIRKDPLYKHLPIIVLTGETTQESHIRALSLGANSYMHKPFEYTEFIDEIKKFLSNQESADRIFTP